MAQPGEDPPLGDEDAGFDSGFVLGRPRAGRDHHGPVVRRQFLIRPIDARLVAAGPRDGALQLVGDPEARRAPEVLDHPGVGADPVGQLLGRGRLGVGEAAGAKHRDEELDGTRLAHVPLDHPRARARVVDEGLLAGAMHLAHRRPQPPDPPPIDRTELAVAIAPRLTLGVFLPQQVQRHAGVCELAVDPRALRPDPRPHRRRPGKQPGLQLGVVEVGGERPAQAQRRGPLQIERDRPDADRAGLGYRPVGQAPLVLES